METVRSKVTLLMANFDEVKFKEHLETAERGYHESFMKDILELDCETSKTDEILGETRIVSRNHIANHLIFQKTNHR